LIPVSSAAQTRELDLRTIEVLGLPGVVLMETASRALAQVVLDELRPGGRVIAVCGGGNNGGDGWGAARWLRSWGVDVAVWACGDSRGDAAIHRAVAVRAGVPLVTSVAGAELIIDALFGTGLAREITGRFAKIVQQIADSGVPVVAADLPSGLCADTGRVLGKALVAVRTVTFGRIKPGLLLGRGPELSGQVDVVDIGVEAAAWPEDHVAAITERSDVLACWPTRSADAYKGSSGHLLIVAGSAAMAGAAVLASSAAVRGGAGLVTLAVPRGAVPRLGALPPEVMVAVTGEGDTLTALPTGDVWARATVIAVGPGLGGGAPLAPALIRQLRALWTDDARPVVFDADAIVAVERSPQPRVLTPHPGEATRILGGTVDDVQRDRLTSARRLAGFGVALLKGRGTLIAQADAPIVFNPTGGPILATGGSGDVLTGLIGALLARSLAPRDAAFVGAYVHGLAAEELARVAPEGWGASDLVAVLPATIASLLSGEG